jgi:hypothetical protein
MNVRHVVNATREVATKSRLAPRQLCVLHSPASSPPDRQRGKIGWLLLWLIGIPVPVLIGLFLLRGCT